MYGVSQQPSLPASWTLWSISMYLGYLDFNVYYLALSKLTTSTLMSLKDFCQECWIVFPKKENTKIICRGGRILCQNYEYHSLICHVSDIFQRFYVDHR